MIRRPQSSDHDHGLRGAIDIVARAVAAMAVAALPVLLHVPIASAQAPPVTVPPVTVPPVSVPPAPSPTAPGVPADVALKAQQSMGVVTIDKEHTIGWIGGPGLVVTSDVNAADVGVSATFALANSKDSTTCYVAVHVPAQRLSVLRCTDAGGSALGVATRYPVPGTPVAVVTLSVGNVVTLATQDGTILANDVRFMHSTRLRFSFLVGPVNDSADAVSGSEAVVGSPVLDANGRVVSTLLAAPHDGGTPIGVIPADLTKAITKGVALPSSFRSAAIIAVGRRAVIPAIAGFVLGIVWAISARSGGAITKVLGLTAVGIVGAVVYSVFTVMVVGPQTLLG